MLNLIEESDVIARAVWLPADRIDEEPGCLTIGLQLSLQPVTLVPRLCLDLEDVGILGVHPDLAAPLVDGLPRGERQGGRERQDVRLAEREPLLAGVLEAEQVLAIRGEYQGPGVGVREIEVQARLGGSPA